MFTVHFIDNAKGNPPGKLADAELHFHDTAALGLGGAASPLAGLKLIGFAVWERRTGGRTITFPARQYSVNGERRSFALLRPSGGDTTATDRVRDLILQAYAEHELAAAKRIDAAGASRG
jgi:hypothetical protein